MQHTHTHTQIYIYIWVAVCIAETNVMRELRRVVRQRAEIEEP